MGQRLGTADGIFGVCSVGQAGISGLQRIHGSSPRGGRLKQRLEMLLRQSVGAEVVGSQICASQARLGERLAPVGAESSHGLPFGRARALELGFGCGQPG